ncbi:MAG: thiolase family protein [Pararhodobacter sp.]|nr:thiolase family protein [Pararhodobacter sp.]
MPVTLRELRPVHVIGVGMHRYQFPSETPYIHMGLTALRAALTDAGLEFQAIESAHVGTTGCGMAAGRVMFRHIGSTGLAVQQIENASASGSFAFANACLEVASGVRDVALAIGVDKYGDQKRAVTKEGINRLSDTASVPLVKYALLCRTLAREKGLSAEDLARVGWKNHNNASTNPFAQFQKPRTLEQVLNSTRVAGDLTSLQCTPRGEGAAAAIVVSDDAMRSFGLNAARAVRVLSSTAGSETLPQGREPGSVIAARDVALRTYREAGITAQDLDVVELHDAFSIEEILYTEAFGLCPEGHGHHYLREGRSAIGGECAVNSSGGLIAQGHPLGPTGVGQIHEIVRQLRGENGDRQQANARIGMAHMIGLGSVAIAHVLRKD